MNLFDKILFKSQGTSATAEVSAYTQPARETVSVREELPQKRECLADYMTLFRTLPEVFWAIDFIASRIAGAHFEVKRTKDDSVVWCGRKVCDMLVSPNCLMGWREFVYTHFVNRLATGNAYVRAAMSTTASNLPKHKYCTNFWPLPADKVRAYAPMSNIPLYSIANIDEIVDHYSLMDGLGRSRLNIPTWQVWHDRDGQIACVANGPGYLKSASRLDSVKKPIANLMAVYEARNVIYNKRGGIGFLVSQKHDETGTTAMTQAEKDHLTDYLTHKYGVGEGQTPIGLTDVPLSFVRTNLSIQELQPFDETLEDAIKIAGAFGIPAVLVPRKDQATFANQSAAEKSVYCGVVIPMAKKFCEDLTKWLGLEENNLYIDCTFSDVDCLQVGLKEAEQVKKLVNDRCRQQFLDGLITLNDWRAQIHESQIDEEEIPFFSKLRFQMDEDELIQVATIIKESNPTLTINQTSTGEDHERNEKEPSVSDEG